MSNPTKPSAADVWTVLKIIRWTTEYLAGKGVESPRLDAEVLLADLLGLDRVQLYLNYDRPLNPDELADYRQRVRRRAAREPVAYITGKKPFYSLELCVNPDVLIPRPETETLVEESLRLIAQNWGQADPLMIADIGVGSGAVALSLAKELGGRARVFAVDVSEPALALARANAEKCGLLDSVAFLRGDLTAPLAGHGQAFHLIAANLPYVSASEMADLAPEIRNYEPQVSLFGGPDGLDLIRRLIPEARGLLRPEGVLLLEIGAGQAAAVRELGEGAGFADIRIIQDLAGRDRAAALSGHTP